MHIKIKNATVMWRQWNKIFIHEEFNVFKWNQTSFWLSKMAWYIYVNVFVMNFYGDASEWNVLYICEMQNSECLLPVLN